jgi:hypothetical protein
MIVIFNFNDLTNEGRNTALNNIELRHFKRNSICCE